MRLFVCLFTLVVAAGCATGPNIALDYDENHDFSGYETFVWKADDPVTVKGGLVVPTVALTAVAQAVRDDLRKKGFVEVQDPADADFGVDVVVGLSEAVVFDSTDRSVYVASEGAIYGVDRPGRRPDSVVVARSGGREERDLDPLARTVSQGKLGIGIYDMTSDRVVWSASGERDITNSVPRGRNANVAVGWLLREFPPKE